MINAKLQQSHEILPWRSSSTWINPRQLGQLNKNQTFLLSLSECRQWSKWARMRCNWVWGVWSQHGKANSSLKMVKYVSWPPQNCHHVRSWAPNLLSPCRTLVFGCRNSVPRSWISRKCWRPILPSLITYLYYDYICAFKFISLFFIKHDHNWYSPSSFCIHGVSLLTRINFHPKHSVSRHRLSVTLCLHLRKVPLPSPLSRHIWKMNCSQLHTTWSNISSAAGASDSNYRHTVPPINVCDIWHFCIMITCVHLNLFAYFYQTSPQFVKSSSFFILHSPSAVIIVQGPSIL